MRIAFHTLLLLAIAFSVWLGLGMYMLMAVAAVLIHESAHAITANRFGIRAKKITLMPFGAQINIDCNFLPRKSQVTILLAGSFANMMVGLLAASVLWLFPQAFEIVGLFIFANVSVAVLNLLPFYPLDGGKVIALSNNKAIKKVLFIMSNAIFIVLFVGALAIQSWLLCFLSACMLLSINTEAKNLYVSKFYKTSGSKKGSVRTVAIQSSATLFEAFRQISHRQYTQFIVTDKGNHTIYETDIEKHLTNNELDTRIVDIL